MVSGAGESARFQTPTGGATLNRVTGADPSAIYGSLTSNGRLFLVNPNGIVVGPTGVIDTAGLVLSTHPVRDAEFLAGRDMTFSGGSAASVVNRGAIRATGAGDVFLIARHVENAGSISAPGGTVGLAGGSEVLIRSTDTGDGRVACGRRQPLRAGRQQHRRGARDRGADPRWPRLPDRERGRRRIA